MTPTQKADLDCVAQIAQLMQWTRPDEDDGYFLACCRARIRSGKELDESHRKHLGLLLSDYGRRRKFDETNELYGERDVHPRDL